MNYAIPISILLGTLISAPVSESASEPKSKVSAYLQRVWDDNEAGLNLEALRKNLAIAEGNTEFAPAISQVAEKNLRGKNTESEEHHQRTDTYFETLWKLSAHPDIREPVVRAWLDARYHLGTAEELLKKWEQAYEDAAGDPNRRISWAHVLVTAHLYGSDPENAKPYLKAAIELGLETNKTLGPRFYHFGWQVLDRKEKPYASMLDQIRKSSHIPPASKLHEILWQSDSAVPSQIDRWIEETPDEIARSASGMIDCAEELASEGLVALLGKHLESNPNDVAARLARARMLIVLDPDQRKHSIDELWQTVRQCASLPGNRILWDPVSIKAWEPMEKNRESDDFSSFTDRMLPNTSADMGSGEQSAWYSRVLRQKHINVRDLCGCTIEFLSQIEEDIATFSEKLADAIKEAPLEERLLAFESARLHTPMLGAVEQARIKSLPLDPDIGRYLAALFDHWISGLEVTPADRARLAAASRWITLNDPDPVERAKLMRISLSIGSTISPAVYTSTMESFRRQNDESGVPEMERFLPDALLTNGMQGQREKRIAAANAQANSYPKELLEPVPLTRFGISSRSLMAVKFSQLMRALNMKDSSRPFGQSSFRERLWLARYEMPRSFRYQIKPPRNEDLKKDNLTPEQERRIRLLGAIDDRNHLETRWSRLKKWAADMPDDDDSKLILGQVGLWENCRLRSNRRGAPASNPARPAIDEIRTIVESVRAKLGVQAAAKTYLLKCIDTLEEPPGRNRVQGLPESIRRIHHEPRVLVLKGLNINTRLQFLSDQFLEAARSKDDEKIAATAESILRLPVRLITRVPTNGQANPGYCPTVELYLRREAQKAVSALSKTDRLAPILESLRNSENKGDIRAAEDIHLADLLTPVRSNRSGRGRGERLSSRSRGRGEPLSSRSRSRGEPTSSRSRSWEERLREINSYRNQGDLKELAFLLPGTIWPTLDLASEPVRDRLRFPVPELKRMDASFRIGREEDTSPLVRILEIANELDILKPALERVVTMGPKLPEPQFGSRNALMTFAAQCVVDPENAHRHIHALLKLPEDYEKILTEDLLQFALQRSSAASGRKLIMAVRESGRVDPKGTLATEFLPLQELRVDLREGEHDKARVKVKSRLAQMHSRFSVKTDLRRAWSERGDNSLIPLAVELLSGNELREFATEVFEYHSAHDKRPSSTDERPDAASIALIQLIAELIHFQQTELAHEFATRALDFVEADKTRSAPLTRIIAHRADFAATFAQLGLLNRAVKLLAPDEPSPYLTLSRAGTKTTSTYWLTPPAPDQQQAIKLSWMLSPQLFSSHTIVPVAFPEREIDLPFRVEPHRRRNETIYGRDKLPQIGSITLPPLKDSGQISVIERSKRVSLKLPMSANLVATPLPGSENATGWEFLPERKGTIVEDPACPTGRYVRFGMRHGEAIPPAAVSNLLPFDPAQNYLLRGFVRSWNNTDSLLLQVRFYDKNNKPLGPWDGRGIFGNPRPGYEFVTGWSRQVVCFSANANPRHSEFPCPPGAVKLRVRLKPNHLRNHRLAKDFIEWTGLALYVEGSPDGPPPSELVECPVEEPAQLALSAAGNILAIADENGGLYLLELEKLENQRIALRILVSTALPEIRAPRWIGFRHQPDGIPSLIIRMPNDTFYEWHRSKKDPTLIHEGRKRGRLFVVPKDKNERQRALTAVSSHGDALLTTSTNQPGAQLWRFENGTGKLILNDRKLDESDAFGVVQRIGFLGDGEKPVIHHRRGYSQFNEQTQSFEPMKSVVSLLRLVSENRSAVPLDVLGSPIALHKGQDKNEITFLPDNGRARDSRPRAFPGAFTIKDAVCDTHSGFIIAVEDGGLLRMWRFEPLSK